MENQLQIDKVSKTKANKKPLIIQPASAKKDNTEQEPVFNKVLDRQKIDELIEEMSQNLSYEDIFEIKKQINLLSKNGKLLPQRIKFMENRTKLLQTKQKAKVGNVTQYVFEDPTPAILISLMQLTSALFTEIINMHMVSGQRTIMNTFKFYVAFKVIALIDNIYLGAIQDSTMQKMQAGAW